MAEDERRARSQVSPMFPRRLLRRSHRRKDASYLVVFLRPGPCVPLPHWHGCTQGLEASFDFMGDGGGVAARLRLGQDSPSLSHPHHLPVEAVAVLSTVTLLDSRAERTLPSPEHNISALGNCRYAYACLVLVSYRLRCEACVGSSHDDGRILPCYRRLNCAWLSDACIPRW